MYECYFKVTILNLTGESPHGRRLQPRVEQEQQQAEREQLLRKPALQRHVPPGLQPARSDRVSLKFPSTYVIKPFHDVTRTGAPSKFRFLPLQVADHVFTQPPPHDGLRPSSRRPSREADTRCFFFTDCLRFGQVLAL